MPYVPIRIVTPEEIVGRNMPRNLSSAEILNASYYASHVYKQLIIDALDRVNAGNEVFAVLWWQSVVDRYGEAAARAAHGLSLCGDLSGTLALCPK